MNDKLVQVGHTKKTHGSHGELKIEVLEAFYDDLLEAEVIFIHVHGKPLPHFVEHCREAADVLLKLEEVNAPDEAKHLTNQPIFLRESDIKHADPNETVDFHELVGFELIGSSEGKLGEIKEVIEMPMQLLAVVDFQGKEVFVPLHPDMVDGLDEGKKQLTLRLPEGLLDL